MAGMDSKYLKDLEQVLEAEAKLAREGVDEDEASDGVADDQDPDLEEDLSDLNDIEDLQVLKDLRDLDGVDDSGPVSDDPDR